MTHEQKPESAEFRTREDQYNDPRFKRELECEIHIATGCRVTLYAEERPTGLAQCSTYDRWVGHWSTPNWHYPVTRFVSVEEMERAVSEAEARGVAEQRRKDAPNVPALEAERNRWKQQAQYETDVAEAAIQKAAALEDRVTELEGEVARLKKPEFYAVSDLEDSWLTTGELMDSLDGDIPHFETVEIDCFRRVSRIWAFYDGKKVREFADKKEAEFSAAAAIREGGE